MALAQTSFHRETIRAVTRGARRVGHFLAIAAAIASTQLLTAVRTTAQSPSLDYDRDILPLLKSYCFDCHGDGASKGQISFDTFASTQELKAQKSLWLGVLKNLQSGLMPPDKKPKPSAEEIHRIEQWITRESFGLDPSNPDPGKVTVRRLNRFEYRNTIRDLTGFNLKIEDELPPDDTGYGFDTIGDVLSLSPLLLEKYMQLAERIAIGAVPRTVRVPAEESLTGSQFKKTQGKGTADRLSVYDASEATNSWTAKIAGTYELSMDIDVLGQFNFDPGKTRLSFHVGETEVWQREFAWQNGKKSTFEIRQSWESGPKELRFKSVPLTSLSEKTNAFDVRVSAIRIRGPMEEAHWVRPKNFEKFFWQDPPTHPEERAKYGRAVLTRFARSAYRRAPSDTTIDRLVAIAESTWKSPGKSFEDGIAQAIVPILASPRFLFRAEAPVATKSADKFPLIDEFSLATRLSYFLWSSAPDSELAELADRGELRKNLRTQVQRMIADKRSDAFIENFTGQWLQLRDVDGIDINGRAVQARDRGEDRELDQRNKRFQELVVIPEDQRTEDQKREIQAIRDRRRAELAKSPPTELDGDLRRAMREESQMAFAAVVREDRSLLELLESDSTFLNERLAKHYGITNVTGTQMRRVALPSDSPRGGILGHAAFHVVSSNPTRTSPVKRGLFLLDNILGTPAPPAPANVPSLEDSEKEMGSKSLTLRETLEFHRQKPLCFSCHNRMDPLGLALENFNALGIWRESERGRPIDPSGKLITGESFQNLRELKHVLATRHRSDFYRCLIEKLLTYSLGRGLEYYDMVTVDKILADVEASNGRFAVLLEGILQSAPFQRTRVSDKDRAGL